MTTVDVREQAIRSAVRVLRTATDWQEAEHALAQERRFDVLWGEPGSDDCDNSEVQAVIREAEERLGDQLPY